VSIRLRVTVVTVVLAALGVGAVDVTTFELLHGYFDKRANASVRQVAQTAVVALRDGKRLTLPAYTGIDRPVLVELIDQRGRVVERVGTSDAGDVRLPAGLLSRPGHGQDIGAANHDGPAFQVMALPAKGGTVVAAVSIKNEVDTLAHIFRLNFIVGGIVLAVLAIIAAIVVTRSLRPLRRIAATADAIADGDLGARVPATPRGSEIGSVATALNRMLAENEAAFSERDATEDKLRQFLADASHELRTPLTSIRGYAELFRRGANERPEDLSHAMGAIEEEATRMTALVEDLLLLAQLDDARPLERQPVELDTLTESAVAAARAIEPDRRIELEFAERPLVVQGDRDRLRQVLDNLLANVRQHTPHGAPALIALHAEGEQVVLVIEDTGPGVPTSEREHVFDRFSRPDTHRARDRGGAGLGLAIVRSIVTAHGGVITLRPARGHGAAFEIRLPRVPAAAA
jgi:two-component system OmpR family sensor kinase